MSGYVLERGGATTLGRSAMAATTGFGPAIERATGRAGTTPPVRRARQGLTTFVGQTTDGGSTWTGVEGASVVGTALAPLIAGEWDVTTYMEVFATLDVGVASSNFIATAAGFPGSPGFGGGGSGAIITSGGGSTVVPWSGVLSPALGLVVGVAFGGGIIDTPTYTAQVRGRLVAGA